MTDFLHLNIVEVGLFVVGVAYVVSFWRQGGNRASTELIQIYEVKDREQRAIIADNASKFETINRELGILKGQLLEKDKKIDEYLMIFQGRSPDQEKYQADMRQFTAGVAKYMAQTLEILTALNASIKGA